ncbi:MAG: LLM class flavin-dependent oxidoreductase [Cryobacterium sp.]|uniref:LLM class flavin-dependent oxidoreductase n=1 Tax=unclassified Chelatococcus TaxID=2638111 RepID=UPI001BD06164|nr:LLM class flavin-dependent oxidoreductase [Chelatococcus sp.]MBS7701151.1 LLM class flavin-dependent oxidoreductase [Chelatococcus sp. YT9]MBX3088020.1 LLM class flavin-dependent oxidoreductase [Cryobacterium sp.]MBX3557282.1 LLM class flavin-dependent oxidoreductase [Chelatococcus sp.]
MLKKHPLKGLNRFKLGVFSANADGGLAISTVPERWPARWTDNVTAAQIADRAGLEFFLPIARWRGYGGQNRVREWSFETFTWAAGLAAATEQIALFMTVHVPVVHPIYAAKALATVDHISAGRAGLNIVCGWSPAEFGMFGISLHEDGYTQAAEWMHVIERCYGNDQPFDFDGKFYTLKDVVSRPAALQTPRPVTMNAAFSPHGRDFAAAHCDFLFTTFGTMEDAGRHAVDVRQRAATAGRDLGLYTVCHVVCRETQAEAETYYHHYAVEMADQSALESRMSGNRHFANDLDRAAFEQAQKRFAGGAGSYPLVGTPEKIVDELLALSEQGYEGAALSFVNYTYELPFFTDRVLPLMREAGLRTA